MINIPLSRNDDSIDIWSFFECFDSFLPWHHTECRCISICDHPTCSLDIARHYLSSTLSCIWIDEVMVRSPRSTSTRRTSQKMIIKNDSSNDLVRGEWTLKSDRPATTTIYISSKINEKSRIYRNHLSD